MRAIVTGATGALGNELMSILPNACPVSLSKGTDLRDLNQVMELADINPTHIFHLAAETDVDLCEEDFWEPHRTTVDTTKNIVKLAEATGARIIYMSTDFVFDGHKGWYREFDTAIPLNKYGQLKLAAESALRIDTHIIIRGTFLSWGSKGEPRWLAKACQNARASRPVVGLVDRISSPVSVHTMAEAMANLALGDASPGPWHVGIDAPHSGYSTISAVLDACGFDTRCLVKREIDEMNFRAPRPKDTSLDAHKYFSFLGHSYNLADEIQYFLNGGVGWPDS